MVSKDHRFGLLPVRSPLLRESRLISFRRVTEMFQFTRFPLSPPMCSAGSLQTSLWRSCLIRILGAHRLHAAPPERFAGLRVLLRFSAPRHPPRTLCSLFFFLVCASRHRCRPFTRTAHVIFFGVLDVFLCFNSCCPSIRLNKIEERHIQLFMC